jgi:Arylsulfotransferase (ASST)
MRNKSNVLSIACTATLAILLLVQVTAWATRAALQGSSRLTAWQIEAITHLANFPRAALASLEEIAHNFQSMPRRLLVPVDPHDVRFMTVGFPALEDPGFLLFTGVSTNEPSTVIKLIRISTGGTELIWRPNWKSIVAQSSPTRLATGYGPRIAQASHPKLLPDGSVVFSTGYSLVKLRICNSEPEWVVPEPIHHSVEIDQDGNFIVPIAGANGYEWSSTLSKVMIDDAIAYVSAEGKLLRRISVAGILKRNGLISRLLGSQGMVVNNDPVHLNGIVVARNNTQHWKSGDLLLSLRNLSALLLYRPSTDKVVWYKTGPWVHQHSAHFSGDRYIFFLNNNSISGVPRDESFLPPSFMNEVVRLDLDTDEVTFPYDHLLRPLLPLTATGGRVQVLDDGGLFLEETEFGRHIRTTKTKVLWVRTNWIDRGQVGVVSWSSYLAADDVYHLLDHALPAACGNLS